MFFIRWLGHNWFPLVQTGLTVAGFLFLGLAILLDAHARRVGNLIRLTREHRELWERMYIQPELARILDPTADLEKSEITAEEEIFVIFLILHLSNTYYAMRAGLFRKLGGLPADIEQFFSFPIPRAVWAKVKQMQEKSFAQFVKKHIFSESLVS